jgi:regulator of protease activity HflC (stomatin/prohibitin superfamily)
MNIDIKKIAKRIFNTSLAVALIGIFFVIIFFWSMCFVYIKPYEYGIKQVNIGIKRGIQERVYTAGYYFVMPFGFEAMHKFPREVQVYTFSDFQNTFEGRTEKAAHIQTSDGFFVDVDVSIIYRIENPLKVINSLGVSDSYIYNGIQPKAEPILKDALGQLTTEEFYNPYLRVEKMELAKEKLNFELNPKGITINQVLIRFFRYSPEIQRNIEDKKLKDQLVFKNQAEAKAAIEDAKLSKIIREGEALVKVELERGKAYRITRNSSRDLFVRSKHAQGDLLIKMAEAQKTKLKNKALEGVGSENLVGLKMAETLEGIEVIVLPSDGKSGVNPLNLEKTYNLFR